MPAAVSYSTEPVSSSICLCPCHLCSLLLGSLRIPTLLVVLPVVDLGPDLGNHLQFFCWFSHMGRDLSWSTILTTAVLAEPTFKRLCYAVPTSGSDRPYMRKCFSNITGSAFRRIIELQGVVTPLDTYPFSDPAALEDVELLQSVALTDGATYVLALDPPPIGLQVRFCEEHAQQET